MAGQLATAFRRVIFVCSRKSPFLSMNGQGAMASLGNTDPNRLCNLGRCKGHCQLALRFFLLFMVCALLNGCRQPEAPDYDRFRSQLVQELFEQMATGNSQAAVRQLERLQELSPTQEFYTLALPRERERLAVQKINILIREGKLEAAWSQAASLPPTMAGSAPIQACRETVAALRALEAYCQQLPFADFATASQASKALARHSRTLIQSESFRQWHDRQQSLMADLQRREARQALGQLIQDCDLLAVAEPDLLPTLLASLAAADPDDRVQPMLLQIIGQTPAPDLHDREPDDFLSVLLQDSVANLAAGAEKNASGPPSSLSGQLNRVWALASDRRLAEAVGQLEALMGRVPVAEAHLARLANGFVLRREQFLARPWQSPCPSITDYLNRVAQIREQASARSRQP